MKDNLRSELIQLILTFMNESPQYPSGASFLLLIKRNSRVRLITKSDQPTNRIGIKLDIHIIQTGKSFRNLFFQIFDCDTAVS